MLLEFSEILPLDPPSRDKLKKEVASGDISSILMKRCQKIWQDRLDAFGNNLSQDIIRFIIISTLDPLWVEHLTGLDNLREGVRLRGYAQKDPLVEYRKEGFEMFQRLMGAYEYNVARKLFRIQVEPAPMPTPTNIAEGRGEMITNDSPSEDIIATNAQAIAPKNAPGRNDLCPCGSGKKYKKCHYPQFG